MGPLVICPDEDEILPVAAGDPAGDPLQEHLEGCPDCRERVERLRAELAALRQQLETKTLSPAPEVDRAMAEVTTEPPAEPAAASAAGDRAEGRAERPGAIGKYLGVEPLDEGGQGQVFRVIHPRLGKDLVLKLGRHPVGADERASLVAESRLLADLEHINLVRIYDLDFHHDRPFLVMEYVHGRNLEQYAAEEPVTPRQAAALVAKLAGALAMVHRRGILHRDIKPRNILIDEAGEPRLIDFGLARRCSSPIRGDPERLGSAEAPADS
jgi:predicted Ser/Thr protein kinase